MTERLKGTHTTSTTAASAIRLVGTTPKERPVRKSASVSSTLPPGVGRKSSARPKKMAPVAIVATMGCRRP